MHSPDAALADPFLRTITVLPVTDILESSGWYRRALGFEAVYLHEGDEPGEATNYAVLRRGNLYMHLCLDEPPPYRQAWTRAGTGYLYLMVRSVDEVYRDVQSSGVAIARELAIENWGARGFNLIDPSGNGIHIEQGEG